MAEHLTAGDVNQIIKEVTGSAEKDRRQTFRRRGRIYKDGGKDFLIAHIKEEFGDDAVKEMRLAPVNALKSWVDRKSVIYARPPIRSVKGDPDKKLMDFYVDVMGLDVIMAKSNRYFNLYSNTELYVIPKKWRGFKLPWVNVVAPFLYSVETDRTDQTEKKVIIFSSFTEKDDDMPAKQVNRVGLIAEEKASKATDDKIESNEANVADDTTFIFWTEEEHFTTDNEGVVLINPLNEEDENPIGRIPSVTLRKEVDNEYWAMQGEDMVDMAMATQLALTDLLSIAKMQGFSIIVFTGPERPQNIEIGLNKSVWLKTEADIPAPTMEYVQASSPLTEYTQLVDRMLEISSTTNLLPGTIFGGQSNSTSGDHELMKSAATMMEIESHKPIMRDAELEVWVLIKEWHNLLFDKNELPPDARKLGKFSEEFTPNVSYQDMKPIETMEQRIKQVDDMDKLGVLSEKDKFQRLFPDMTDDDIKAKLKEIAEDKKARIAEFGFPPPPGATNEEENTGHEEEENTGHKEEEETKDEGSE